MSADEGAIVDSLENGAPSDSNKLCQYWRTVLQRIDPDDKPGARWYVQLEGDEICTQQGKRNRQFAESTREADVRTTGDGGDKASEQIANPSEKKTDDRADWRKKRAEEYWAAISTGSCRAPTHDYDCDEVRSYLEQFPVDNSHAADAETLLQATAAKIEALYQTHARHVGTNTRKGASTTTKPTASEISRLGEECARGKRASCLLAGDFLARGDGKARDQTRANELLKKACFEGTTQGCRTVVGNMLADGNGVPKDLPKALASFEAGCPENDYQSCYNAGTMYENGEGTKANLAAAFRFYWTACDGGLAAGCFRVGVLYREGTAPVPKSTARAMEAFAWACEAGHAESCRKMGAMYALGDGLPQDYTKALVAFRKACTTGDADGCSNAERLVSDGLGLSPDEARAQANLRAIATQKEAQHPEVRAWLARMRQDPATLDPLSRSVQDWGAAHLVGKPCRHFLSGELLQKLAEHTYEVVITNDVDPQQPLHVILKTRRKEFSRTGPVVVCIRPEETWTTVTTAAGFTVERMVLEEAE